MEIGTEAALFPEKEYLSGIFVAVHDKIMRTGAMCACQLISEEKNNPGTFDGNFARGRM